MMSGREPVAAFFPSIDRNLIAELDRHLRAPQAPAPAKPIPAVDERVDIDGVVEAVEKAASSIVAMTTRIQELESHVATLTATNRDLGQKLAASTQRREVAEAQAESHLARADEAEGIAAQHVARADSLEQELAAALADLNRVTDAISNALGLPASG